jgi:hypothetical protein
LWFGWFAPGESYQAGPFQITVPHDAPKYPSFENVTLFEVVLEQMIQSVIDFWEDLECMRCNSFRNMDESVVRRLAAWPEERSQRRIKRVWTPT